MTTTRRPRWSRLLAALTGTVLAVGASGLAVALPAHAAPQDGVYTGENSHGFDFSITVSGGAVTNVVTTSYAACGVPPINTAVPFNEIPVTPIAADGSFSANWTYQIDADYSAEYWLGGVFNDDGTVTSAGSNAADMIGVGLLCEGMQFSWDAAVAGVAPEMGVTPNPATLSQAQDPAGALNITGSGFVPGSTVALTVNGEQAAERTADDQGDVAVQLAWLNATVGQHTLRLVSGSRSAETTLTIVEDPSYSPTAAVDPATVTVSGLAGAGVAVSGTDFPPSTAVELAFDGAPVTTVTSGADGSVAATLVRAGVAPGAHTVRLTAGQWSAEAALTVEADPVQYDPEASASPASLTVEQLGSDGVTIEGIGFPPNEPVAIAVDGETVATVAADANGGLTHVFVRADVATGPHSVVLSSGQWSAETGFEVTEDPIVYEPETSVSPGSVTQSGLAGTGVGVTGTGFPENADVELRYDGELVTTVRSDANGAVSTQLVRAGAPVGTSTVLLRSGQWEASAQLVVTEDPAVPAEVVLTPNELSSGELEGGGVALDVDGLPAGLPVRVLFDGDEVGAFTSSPTGGGSLRFSVADVVPGSYLVQLVEGPGFAPILPVQPFALVGPLAAGDVLGEATLTVTADPGPGEPTLELAQTSIASDALAGAGVALTASGFTAGEEVSVFFDGEEIGTAVPDGDGEVRYTLRASGVEPGEYEVTVGRGDRIASATLTVTAASGPGTPGPGTPGPGTPAPGQSPNPGAGDGSSLADTGVDGAAIGGLTLIAMALLAAGGTVFLRRRLG